MMDLLSATFEELMRIVACEMKNLAANMSDLVNRPNIMWGL